MPIEVDTAEAPAHWACYLINGDASCIDEEDIKACDAWQESLAPWYVVSCQDDEEPFMRQWDGLLTDCITYILHKQSYNYC